MENQNCMHKGWKNPKWPKAFSEGIVEKREIVVAAVIHLILWWKIDQIINTNKSRWIASTSQREIGNGNSMKDIMTDKNLNLTLTHDIINTGFNIIVILLK